MTPGVVRRKRIADSEEKERVQKRRNGLWIDRARLPTTLAQIGKKRELAPLEPWSTSRSEHLPDRILDYADIVLGPQKQRRATDKRKR